MHVIGIDPGTRTGWSVCKNGEIRESGVMEFALTRGESPGMRFLRFRRWLGDLCSLVAEEGVTLVLAYERAHHRGGHATELGVGLCTRIQEVAAERGHESLPVPSGTLKKWATGSGSADKEQMVQRAMHLTGRISNLANATYSDDEADAVLVSLWAWAQAE